MIAKNLPTGSYAAGCPTGTREGGGWFVREDGSRHMGCSACELVN